MFYFRMIKAPVLFLSGLVTRLDSVVSDSSVSGTESSSISPVVRPPSGLIDLEPLTPRFGSFVSTSQTSRILGLSMTSDCIQSLSIIRQWSSLLLVVPLVDCSQIGMFFL